MSQKSKDYVIILKGGNKITFKKYKNPKKAKYEGYNFHYLSI